MKNVAALAAVAALTGFLLTPAPGYAQLRLIPQGGLYASVTDLGQVDTGDEVLNVGEHATSLALGLTLEMGAERALAFRLGGLYGTDSEVPVGGIGCEGAACDLKSTVLGLSGSLVLRPIPYGSPFRPYILGGGGLKRYAFDFDSDSPVKDAFDDESLAAAVLGLGFDWDIGILRGNLELTDYISGSIFDDGDSQHDFFLTVGIILGR